MSSLHNDLDAWSNKSERLGHNDISINNDTARSIASDLRKLAALEDAFDTALTGGNHLACQLISRLGADFSLKYPYDMGAEKAVAFLPDMVDYDMWCAWSAMMLARESLET